MLIGFLSFLFWGRGAGGEEGVGAGLEFLKFPHEHRASVEWSWKPQTLT